MASQPVSRAATFLLIGASLVLLVAGLTDTLAALGGAPAYGAPGSPGAVGSLAASAPATGPAVYGEAAGQGKPGVVGYSSNVYGVWGETGSGWGGYFHSDNGYGVRVDTDGNDHWDHAGYFTANAGWGILAQSASNQGVRGEAGDLTGIPLPLGPVGVVGLGSNRGMYGASNSGIGIYGASDSNYGMWGASDSYRGVTGRTSRTDNNYGLYTPDNLYSLNFQTLASQMQIVANGGAEALEPGDVVAFSGILRAETLEQAALADPENPALRAAVHLGAPVVQVSRARADNAHAVAGIVYSRFNLAALDPELDRPDGAADLEAGDDRKAPAEIEITPAGPVAPGEYLLVVVRGPAEAKVDPYGAPLRPGDLVGPSLAPGAITRSEQVTAEGLPTVAAGSVVGKALEATTPARDRIYVFVSL